MTNERRSVAIVIPVHNRREITLQALRSLSRIDATNLKVDIFIVDDGSTDGTGDAIRKQYPEVELIVGDGTLHYAAGTNRGITAALEVDPEFILTANDDSVFHEQFLQQLISASDKNPRSVIGAMLLLWNDPHRSFQVDFKWNTVEGGWCQTEGKSIFDFPQQPFEVEGLAGNCVLIPADAVRKCGVMDEERFPHGWGDIQYFVRIRRAGWRLFVAPRSYVWCEPNTNPRPLHELGLKDGIFHLFKNRRHPLNLQRQFIARWESAPTKGAALGAFASYIVQLGGKTIKVAAKSITHVARRKELHPQN